MAAITSINDDYLLIGPLRTNFNRMLIKIHQIYTMIMQSERSYVKWRPFCSFWKVHPVHFSKPIHSLYQISDPEHRWFQREKQKSLRWRWTLGGTNCIDKVIRDWGDIIRFILCYIYWGICWMIYIFHSTLIVCFISVGFRVLADSSDAFTHHSQGSVTGNWIFFFTWGQFWPLGIVIARACMFVCVCVRQSRGFPHDNSSTVPARTTKFGKKLQNNFVKVPIVGGDWPCPSRSNWICSFTLIEYRAGVTLAIVTPICNLKRNIAARCFYCSVNPLRLWELYLLPVLPYCARTNSNAIDLITSKVRYFLWITAELCLQGSVSRMRTSGHACMIH